MDGAGGWRHRGAGEGVGEAERGVGGTSSELKVLARVSVRRVGSLWGPTVRDGPRVVEADYPQTTTQRDQYRFKTAVLELSARGRMRGMCWRQHA
jgi:hypothetical protein